MPRPASSTVALSDLVGLFEVSAVVKQAKRRQQPAMGVVRWRASKSRSERRGLTKLEQKSRKGSLLGGAVETEEEGVVGKAEQAAVTAGAGHGAAVVSGAVEAARE